MLLCICVRLRRKVRKIMVLVQRTKMEWAHLPAEDAHHSQVTTVCGRVQLETTLLSRTLRLIAHVMGPRHLAVPAHVCVAVLAMALHRHISRVALTLAVDGNMEAMGSHVEALRVITIAKMAMTARHQCLLHHRLHNVHREKSQFPIVPTPFACPRFSDVSPGEILRQMGTDASLPTPPPPPHPPPTNLPPPPPPPPLSCHHTLITSLSHAISLSCHRPRATTLSCHHALVPSRPRASTLPCHHALEPPRPRRPCSAACLLALPRSCRPRSYLDGDLSTSSAAGLALHSLHHSRHFTLYITPWHHDGSSTLVIVDRMLKSSGTGGPPSMSQPLLIYTYISELSRRIPLKALSLVSS